MLALFIENMAPIMFMALIVFLLLGYPVAFALSFVGLSFALIGIQLDLFHPSFLQAMVRERVVAGDWLISLEANRYSVPFGLIGKTVQVVREGGHWVVRYRGAVVAEHPVLAGRAQLSVHPEHGPGAVARNQLRRHGEFGPPDQPAAHEGREVEVRDLAVYERLVQAAVPQEVAA